MVRLLLACALLFGQANMASAQIVRGHVTEVGSDAPLQGVFVVLQDSSGHMRAGVLTDSKGFYAMVAPEPGRFSLRAERIGHRTTTSPTFSLSADSTTTVDLRVPVAAIELAPIDVDADHRCLRRRNQGLRAAQLWDEARKALRVASWVGQRKDAQFVARSYTRELAMPGLQVRNESVRMLLSGRRPYAAISADSAVRFGFVQNRGDGYTYYGPDAELLLSDEFLDQHCFYTIKGSGDNRDNVGLAFQPTLDLKVPSIKGVLWLDEKSLALQHIEFEYVNVPRALRARGSGGRTEFRQLKSGAWIVGRWYIRMPTTVTGGTQGYRPLVMWEEGGEVLSLRDPEIGTEFKANEAAIMGVVYDSVHGRPLGGATVYLSGTAYRTTADALGRYHLDAVRAGTYAAAFSHPVLDSLPGGALQTTTVTVDAEPVGLPLGLAPAQRLLTTVCGPDVRPESGVLFGYVRNANGGAESGATVHVVFGHDLLAVKTNTAGYYEVCGVPLAAALNVRAFAGAFESALLQLAPRSSYFERVDLKWKD